VLPGSGLKRIAKITVRWFRKVEAFQIRSFLAGYPDRGKLEKIPHQKQTSRKTVLFQAVTDDVHDACRDHTDLIDHDQVELAQQITKRTSLPFWQGIVTA